MMMKVRYLSLLALLPVTFSCATSGVCGGGGYCSAPPAAPCHPQTCQPGYSCGQYGCARNRARSSLTQKVDGIFISDLPEGSLQSGIASTEKPQPKVKAAGPTNIFGMRRGASSGRTDVETPNPSEETVNASQTKPDNATISQMTNPNFIFRQCCEQRGLPDACLSKCHFNTYTKDSLQAMYFKTDACPLEAAADMQFCAAQGRDHTQCCLRNGVTTTLAGQKCLTFCDQRPDRITKLDYSYVPCYDRFENIKRCFYNEIKEKAEQQFGLQRRK